MQIVNDTTFVGVLNMKIGPIALTMDVNVRAEAISPIDSLTTLVTARKGPFASSLRVCFTLEATGEDCTSVACTATEEAGSPLLRLLRPHQRRFSAEIFESIQEGLERSC